MKPKYKVTAYRNQYDQEFMKIFVNDSLVFDRLEDEFKLKLVENIFNALNRTSDKENT